MAKGECIVATESDLGADAEEMDHAEQHVLSLYKNFQSSRVPDRERVISHVMSTVEKQSLHQHKNVVVSESESASIRSEVTFLDWLRSFFTFETGAAWQTAAVFSLALILTSVVSLVYVEQEKTIPTTVASIPTHIPSLLYKNRHAAVQKIQPRLNTQFGFSSSYEEYQIAFRSGLLLVEMPLLVRTEQQNKLQQLILEASLILKQSGNPNFVQTMDKFVAKIIATNDTASRISLVDNYIVTLQKYFSSRTELPLFEFGQWLEVSLLTTQLENVDRSSLIKQLLQQGQVVIQKTDDKLISEPAILALMQQIQIMDTNSIATTDGMDNLRKKLQHIKAALL